MKHWGLQSGNVVEHVVARAVVVSHPCLYRKPGQASVKHKPPGSLGVLLNLVVR